MRVRRPQDVHHVQRLPASRVLACGRELEEEGIEVWGVMDSRRAERPYKHLSDTIFKLCHASQEGDWGVGD